MHCLILILVLLRTTLFIHIKAIVRCYRNYQINFIVDFELIVFSMSKEKDSQLLFLQKQLNLFRKLWVLPVTLKHFLSLDKWIVLYSFFLINNFGNVHCCTDIILGLEIKLFELLVKLNDVILTAYDPFDYRMNSFRNIELKSQPITSSLLPQAIAFASPTSSVQVQCFPTIRFNKPYYFQFRLD
jgi:hypothetical protein